MLTDFGPNWAFFYPAGAAAGYCILLVSSFFLLLLLLLLLLATLLRLISQSCLDRFQPDLVTRTPDPAQPVIQPTWGQRSCRGHRGQKGHFTQNATPPTDYRIWSRDSCTYISLTPSTKVMGLKNHLGSFGVTGVKKSFSPKMLLLLHITWHGYVTHAYPSARSLLSKLWV